MLRWLALLILAGCGALKYAEAPEGKFHGSLFVMWVKDTQGGLGDGTFVFVPTQDPLRFVRAKQGVTMQTIRPGIMYTDGGSIPQFAQAFKGFSPWGYAPAYMVHDWLFLAKRCWDEPGGTKDEAIAASMPFLETADVAAEAIRTLILEKKVSDGDFAPEVISRVLAGPITQRLWDVPGECVRVSEDHLKQIYRAVPGLADPRARRVLGDGPKAEIIQIVEFD